MGQGKKEASRRSATKESRISAPVKGENFYRDAKKLKQVRMLKSGRPTRNKQGQIIKAAEYQERLPSGTVGRVQADRRWFGKFCAHWLVEYGDLISFFRQYANHWSTTIGKIP